jgi:hypothetical protein
MVLYSAAEPHHFYAPVPADLALPYYFAIRIILKENVIKHVSFDSTNCWLDFVYVFFYLSM